MSLIEVKAQGGTARVRLCRSAHGQGSTLTNVFKVSLKIFEPFAGHRAFHMNFKIRVGVRVSEKVGIERLNVADGFCVGCAMVQEGQIIC